MSLSKSTRRRHALALARRRVAAGAPKKELKRYADELELDVTGTGSGGAVTKDDLIRALTGEHPNEPEDDPEEVTNV